MSAKLRLEHREVFYPSLTPCDGYVFTFRLYHDNTEQCELPDGRTFDNRWAMYQVLRDEHAPHTKRGDGCHTICPKPETRTVIPWQWAETAP